MTAGTFHSGSQPVKLPLVRGFALQINHSEWAELRTAGIVARVRMKVDFSSTHRRFVLCAEESGGATANIGHYCGFLPLAGDPTFFARPVTLAMPNTVHADVSAASLVSIEMLRYGTTYTLNIFLHWLTTSQGPDVLPAHRQKLLFSANRGVLSQPLWQEGKTAQVGSLIPAFHRRTGDPLLIPTGLREAVGAITDAVCCVGCRKLVLMMETPANSGHQESEEKIAKESHGISSCNAGTSEMSATATGVFERAAFAASCRASRCFALRRSRFFLFFPACGVGSISPEAAGGTVARGFG